MERYRPYNRRRSVSHRHRSASTYDTSYTSDKSSPRAIKLFICAGLFAIAAVTKLLFPSALEAVGDKINSVVNYKAALTALGQGISGEKKFTTALGEAFTYAFTGDSVETPDDGGQPQSAESETSDETGFGESADATVEAEKKIVETGEETTEVFAENKPDEVQGRDVKADPDEKENEFSDAVIAAFIQSQDEFSDYAIPAGVTYEMPRIGIDYNKPAEGEVSSPFGYRIHPADKSVKFHYGTDIAAKKGTQIKAFADGKVVAAGESSTYGKYVILHHGDIESQYAHCDSISVKSGQNVKKGEKIACVGDSGNATNACLHFELKVNGQYVNPEYYVQWK